MGEEWLASQPFPFFSDFEPDLGQLVRDGRRQEFARFPEFHDPAVLLRIPDPQAPETFASAKLRWEDADRSPHREWLDWYECILAARRQFIIPLIPRIESSGRFSTLGKGAVSVDWGPLFLEANLSPEPVDGFAPEPAGVIWQEGKTEHGRSFQPWTVRWSLR
jgi:1,4-alpha-glucan branching enzyme